MQAPQESQTSQEKPGGNTKTPGYQAYCWCFTWPETVENEIKISPSQISQVLKPYCKGFSFQLEKAPSGYVHYQGQFSLVKKENMNTLKNIFGSKPHFEKTKDYFASLNYTKKDDTRISGPWDHNSSFIGVITTLFPWQKKALNVILQDKSDRTIHWLWDSEGNKGKTQFCKYMHVNHDACILGNGAMKDIACALPDEDPKVVIFNLTRDLEERVNYSAMEALKDGMIFSSKYKSKMRVFNSPVLMVFANFEPRLDSMSRDRWNVINIDQF